MRRRNVRLVVACAVALTVGFCVVFCRDLVTAGPATNEAAAMPSPVEPTPQSGDPQAADRKAIAKATASLLKAVEAGDAKAVAGHFTENGEYLATAGVALRGRAAIATAYAEMFKSSPKIKVVHAELESLRFLSKDTAIEDGVVRIQKGDAEPVNSHYSVLHVREDGRWLIAVLREVPAPAVSLRDLEWLVGQWTASKDGTDMLVRFEWSLNKSFLQGRFTVKAGGKDTEGMQIIGRDPATGHIRSWTFEGEGGFGHAVWTLEKKTWVLEASGVQPDGSILTATNILIRIDDNTFTWQTTQRTFDGESLPDLPPIRVTRVKGK